MLRVLVSLSVVFSLCVGVLADDTFQLEDLKHFVRITDPVFSPDGSKVLVTVSEPDYEENHFARKLVMIDVASGDQRALTHHRPKVRHPRWKNDGQHVAFLDSVEDDDGDKANQVFLLPLAGGEARQITDPKKGIASFEFSADGRALFYVSTEPDPEEPEGDAKHNKSFVVGHHDYQAEKRRRPAHLWRMSLDDEMAPKRLNGEDVSVAIDWIGGIHVSPDGASVAFGGFPAGYLGDLGRVELVVLDAKSGARRALRSRLPNVNDVSYSPDGKSMTYSKGASAPYFSSHAIYLASSSGERARKVTGDLDLNFGTAHWMPDGKSVIVGASEGLHTNLWRQPLKGKPRKLDLGELDVSGRNDPVLDISSKGALVFVATTVGRPDELYVMDSLEARPRRLTHVNKTIENMSLAQAEGIQWKTHDGMNADGVLLYPPGYDSSKKYPLVLKIHGGPMSASTMSFDVNAQLLASRGWLVFMPNYRGSTNLGNAFQAAVIGDAGAGPGRDVMAGLEVVTKKGIVDESRIAVSGWSYGGFMTSWLIGHNPDVWAAAVAGAPVTDFLDQYTLSDVNTGFHFGFPHKPWTATGKDLYRDQSPISHVHDAKAPTLILCDTGDLRVPITESYKLYHALDDNGVTVQFVAYPVNGHFPGDPVHRKDVYRRWADWIEEWFGKVGAE